MRSHRLTFPISAAENLLRTHRTLQQLLRPCSASGLLINTVLYHLCMCRSLSVRHQDAVFIAKASQFRSQCVSKSIDELVCLVNRILHLQLQKVASATAATPTVLGTAGYVRGHTDIQFRLFWSRPACHRVHWCWSLRWLFLFPVLANWLFCYQTQPSPSRPVYDSVTLLLRLPADADWKAWLISAITPDILKTWPFPLYHYPPLSFSISYLPPFTLTRHSKSASLFLLMHTSAEIYRWFFYRRKGVCYYSIGRLSFKWTPWAHRVGVEVGVVEDIRRYGGVD